MQSPVGRRAREPDAQRHTPTKPRAMHSPKAVPSAAGIVASDLRDHEHDGHDGERDPADGEQPDGAEPQRCVPAGSQRTLELALALRADEQQPDREDA